MKTLNAKGFAHWILPLVVIAIVGAVGAYVAVTKSSANTTAVSAQNVTCTIAANPIPSRGKASTYTIKINNTLKREVSVWVLGHAFSSKGNTGVLNETVWAVAPKKVTTIQRVANTPSKVAGANTNRVQVYVLGGASENPPVLCNRSFGV